jgi:hypothetical protein
MTIGGDDRCPDQLGERVWDTLKEEFQGFIIAVSE